MGILREIPVTAGFPLKINDILSLSGRNSRACTLEDDFKAYLDVPYARTVYSGTASLYFILESIKSITAKKTVIIPSYTCPLVPLAIKRAGFNIEICDVTGHDFNYDRAGLDTICSARNDIAAIMAVHMGGIPVDMGHIETAAKRSDAFLIEDCALSLGAEYKGIRTGAIGDFSFFSLCRGKGVTMYEGGIIAAKKPDHGHLLDGTIKRLVRPDPVAEAVKILELFGYGIFYRPRLFWFVYKLPEAFWKSMGREFKAGGEEYDIGFPTHSVSAVRRKIGHSMFLRLDNEVEKRREKASYYMEKLKNTRGIKVISEPSYARASYPYLMVFFEKPGMALNIRKRFFDMGLGVSDLYTCPINEYSFLEKIMPEKVYPNARRMARDNITLSTSDFIGKKDMDVLLDALAQCDQDYAACNK